MKFSDIKKFPFASYRCDLSWSYLKLNLERWENDRCNGNGLILQPEYQRGYVWSEKQQIAYVEYILRGGTSGKDIYFNGPRWPSGADVALECVDGQQRIGAALAFLDNKIKVFGHYRNEFEDDFGFTDASFKMHVTEIADRAELVRWYIQLNTGGSIHTETDLAPAYELLESLEKKQK